MNCKTAWLLAAALLTLSIAGESRAGSMSFYYNVDSQTLPGGPIELETPMATNLTAVMDGFQVTMSGDAYNDSATETIDDVLFLNQWAFQIPSGAAYTFSSGVWSDTSGDTVQLDSPNGFLPMTDTNAPLMYAPDSIVASLASSDSPPYVDIGTIAPGQSVPFSFVVDMNNEVPFNLDGSFVSVTPIPEPSTLALAGFGAIALVIAARRRWGINRSPTNRRNDADAA